MFLIFMRCNYTHEIFTGCIFGHYFFMMNEKVLEMIYGIEYINGEVELNVDEPIVKNYDTKFESIDSSRRIHSLMYKDEGGNVYDIEESKDNKKKKIIEIENKIKESDDSINNDNENIIVEDNTNNIPQQVIVPNED